MTIKLTLSQLVDIAASTPEINSETSRVIFCTMIKHDCKMDHHLEIYEPIELSENEMLKI